MLFQLHLLNADKSTSDSKSDEDDYDDDGSGSIDLENIVHDIADHWRNCTFNNIVYYDDECSEWLKIFNTKSDHFHRFDFLYFRMRNFYLILSLSALGLIVFFLMVVFCTRKYCCSRNAADFERLIEDQHV